MRLVAPLIVFLFLGLFLVAAMAPLRGRRLERWVDGKLETGEEHGHDKGGRFGDLSAKSIRVLRRGANNSATAGRRVRKKLER